MKELWLAIYIVDAVLVFFFFIPFAMFYYEGDQDKSVCYITSELCSVFPNSFELFVHSII